MNPRVLVVDDSLTVRMDLGEALEAAGFSVHGCATLEAAREALAGERFALLVLDVLLPDGDGLDFLAELKRGPLASELPVMLLTSEAEVRDRVRGWSIGADDYVGKPYEADYVVARARQLVRPGGVPAEPLAGTLLVVDDSATYRGAMKTLFESQGYDVVVAATGEDGLRVAAAIRPLAVIVDGGLPGIDGETVVRRLRLDPAMRRTPIMVLTASEDATHELGALEAGADAFVRKEADDGVILARLAAVLRTARAAPPLEATESALGPKRILAVDDSATYRHALAEQLRGEGYEVAVAESGEQALDLLAVQPVDCVLLDLLMPGLSGTETCRHIRGAPTWRDLPVIMLTAMDDRDAMIAGINAGADDYISKGSGFDVLKARMRAQLRRKQFEDENRHIREQLLRKELDASEARAARELAETRAALLADVQERNEALRQANAALLVSRDRAERESHFKTRFLANMSHELRTPLNAIIGFSELLEEEIFGPLNPRQNEYVGHVLLSGRHLLGLINDVLDLSKIEAGREELRREWIDLGVLFDAVHGNLQPLADKRGVKLQVSLPEDLPQLHADPIRLKQVLYNLLSNAIKFTPRDGTVDLCARAKAGGVEIDVVDTGIGIRPEDIPRLFREFEQIEPAAGEKPEGTGLGLALSRRLVELHGGTIRVHSEAGRGSTFTVQLPVAEDAPVPAEDDVREGSLVLVVEDDVRAADLLCGHLRAAGLSVAHARDCTEAIRLARMLQPAAITLDVLLPGADGWAVLAQLRTDPGTKAIPVVIVSVVDDASQGLVLGAADYLVKPVDRDALYGALEAIGLHLFRPNGLEVLLVGKGNGDLDHVEANLRRAGCAVRRLDAVGSAGATEGRVDLIVLDLAGDPSDVAPAIAQLEPLGAEVPVLGLVGTGTAWDPTMQTVSYANATNLERIVRAVEEAVARGAGAHPRMHAATGLPLRQTLLARLRATLRRAERDLRAVAVVGVRVELAGASASGESWSALLEPRLRAGDYLAVPADDVLVLVLYGIDTHAVAAVAERFVQDFRLLTGVPATPPVIVWYPSNATQVEELLDLVIERVRAQVGP